MMDIGSRSHTNTQGGRTPSRPARTKPIKIEGDMVLSTMNRSTKKPFSYESSLHQMGDYLELNISKANPLPKLPPADKTKSKNRRKKRR